MGYSVTRKLQEQSGTYYVALPKLWVQAHELKESDLMTVRFNGVVQIEPAVSRPSTNTTDWQMKGKSAK